MADVQFNPESTDIDLLQGQGLRAYVLQDYETACRIYSNVSELLVEKHQSDIHDDLGDVYLNYGKSLLELSRKEGDALNDGVIKNVPVDDDDEDEQDEDDDGGEEQDGEGEGEGDEEEAEKGDENKVEEAEKKEGEGAEKDGGDKSNGNAAGSEAVAGTSSGAAQEDSAEKAEEAEEDATDLQLAWEVLELAKKIFTNRGEAGHKHLAETLVVLGEVALESGNYKPGIDDMSEGLRMQKTLFPEDSRVVAETCFILGGAYSSDGQIDNSIGSYQECLQRLNKRLANLKAANSKENADEIEEIESLIPEVEEKVADMLNFKEEIAKREAQKSAAEAAPSNGTAASSSKQASDISHLVKRKRKSEGSADAQPAAKKPTPEK